jgi:PAS domain S-box-containing protein
MAESRPIRILYMEDNPALARLLQKSLRRKGYEVDLAADGAAGLAALEGTSYDLILADYDMPVCGGIEVITTLAVRGVSIPVIMVTGNGSEKVAVEALKRGAADYVVKDLEMGYIELLPIVIEQVMTRQELLREKELMIEMIRDREERYRRLVELSPDGIAIHVGERIAFINAAGARLLGASDPTGVVGRRVPDLVSPDYLGLVLDQLASGADAAPWFEERLTLRDGRSIDVEIAAVPFSHEGEEALQVIIRDITEKGGLSSWPTTTPSPVSPTGCCFSIAST